MTWTQGLHLEPLLQPIHNTFLAHWCMHNEMHAFPNHTHRLWENISEEPWPLQPAAESLWRLVKDRSLVYPPAGAVSALGHTLQSTALTVHLSTVVSDHQLPHGLARSSAVGLPPTTQLAKRKRHWFSSKNQSLDPTNVYTTNWFVGWMERSAFTYPHRGATPWWQQQTQAVPIGKAKAS
jgi:hypothetical protein